MAVQSKQLFANWTTRKQIGPIIPMQWLQTPSNIFSVVSWSLILSVAAIHSLVPYARSYTTSLYDLPYAQGNGKYVQGSEDALFVLGWLVLMTAIRATIIECIYEFVTRLRVMSRKASMRFAEQGFLLIYDFTSFSMGMVRSPLANLRRTSSDFRLIAHPRKFVLLAQFRGAVVYLALP